MNTLTEPIDGVIGVDTHRDTLAAAAINAVGATLGNADAPATAEGYRQLLDFARTHLPSQRCWAVEGTSSYGAGLTAFLIEDGERVVEYADRNARHHVVPAKATPSMLSGPPGRSSAATTSSNRAGADIAKPFAS